MTNKIFIGGLSWDTDDDGLRGAFIRFGNIIEAKVITDRDTGRSRGFGFVTFADPSSAQTAIKEMDGTPIDGRNVRVNEAEEKQRRGHGGSGNGRPREGRPREGRPRGGRPRRDDW
jgi:RNA recognition motif-containing protein